MGELNRGGSQPRQQKLEPIVICARQFCKGLRIIGSIQLLQDRFWGKSKGARNLLW